MTIYKGEQITFRGFLKDDTGLVITDLSGYIVSAALSKGDSIIALWSTATVENAASITANNSTGQCSFVLTRQQTASMKGKYVFEMKVTNISSQDSVIATSSTNVDIVSSNIGTINNI